jgi:hypothetical protein
MEAWISTTDGYSYLLEIGGLIDSEMELILTEAKVDFKSRWLAKDIWSVLVGDDLFIGLTMGSFEVDGDEANIRFEKPSKMRYT